MLYLFELTAGGPMNLHHALGLTRQVLAGPSTGQAFCLSYELVRRDVADRSWPQSQKFAVTVARSVRGSTGWKWMSSTGAASPGSRDS